MMALMFSPCRLGVGRPIIFGGSIGYLSESVAIFHSEHIVEAGGTV